jgi:hypothetical protein
MEVQELFSRALKLSALATLFAFTAQVMAGDASTVKQANTGSGPLIALFECKSGKEVWHVSERSRTPPRLLMTSGFCGLHGGDGNYSCEQGTCSGSCKLHTLPVYCSCN